MKRAALLLFLCVAGPALASLPPLPLPAWVLVELAMDRAPELDGTATLTIKLTAPLARLEGVKWELDLPREFDVATGPKSGVVTLEQGKVLEVRASLHARAAVEGATLGVEVTSRPPRAELAAEVERAFPAQKEYGMKLIAGLPKQVTERRFVNMTVTPDESWLADARDPVYRFRVKAGAAELVLLDALPGLDAKTVEKRLSELEPRLERLAKIATGKPADPLTPVVEKLRIDRTQLRYQRALLELAAGKPEPAAAELSAPDVAGVQVAPTLQAARRIAYAAALAATKDLPGALQRIDAVLTALPPGPGRRYAEYDRAEFLRASGKPDEAKAAYQRALEASPGFTLARRRLQDLH